jgi:hypothetical protein
MKRRYAEEFEDCTKEEIIQLAKIAFMRLSRRRLAREQKKNTIKLCATAKEKENVKPCDLHDLSSL